MTEAATVRWKGGTVVGIDPPGDRYPIYQRAAYLAGQAPAALRLFPSPACTLHW
jgi:hypothetical protein